VFNGDSDGLGIIWYLGLIGIFTRNVDERKSGDPLKEVIHSAGDHTGPPPMRTLVANDGKAYVPILTACSGWVGLDAPPRWSMRPLVQEPTPGQRPQRMVSQRTPPPHT
jgi:hypothetical protein